MTVSEKLMAYDGWDRVYHGPISRYRVPFRSHPNETAIVTLQEMRWPDDFPGEHCAGLHCICLKVEGKRWPADWGQAPKDRYVAYAEMNLYPAYIEALDLDMGKAEMRGK